MSLPLVSVIMPVYNAQRDLERCLRSLLAQRYGNWEAILINDGSKDGSEGIIHRYAQADSRFKWKTQPNAGPGAARNAGLKMARGEYLQFVDADDCLPPHAIECLVEAVQGCDLAIGHFELCVQGATTRRGLVNERRNALGREFLDLVIKWPGSYYYSALWNKLYSSRIVLEHGLAFEESFIWGEDCLFNMSYYCHVRSASYVPEVVYRYYRKVGGLSWGSVFQLHKGVRIKATIYRGLKHLYMQAGLFPEYRWRVRMYVFNVTLMD